MNSLLEFVTATMPDFRVSWHHRLLCRHLDRFARGECKRLMIFMPPRHSKSQLVSRHLPAQLLGNNPDRNVIACSYSADLASRMNRDVQRIMDSETYRSVFPGVRLAGPRVEGSKGHIRTSDLFEVVGRRGSYRSAGVGGGITGMGFDWGVIDDPVKNREEADSPAHREAVWEWYTSTFYTRRAPQAGILLTTTRWHPEDLAGRLLAQAEADPKADQWEVIRLPAIATDDRHPEDVRRVGEALWPEFYPVSDLEKVRAQSAYDWASMYQQEPRPEGGTEWPDSHFHAGLFFDDWPHPNDIIAKAMGMDPAKGKEAKHGDYAAFTMMALDKHGTLWVEADLHRGKPMEFLVDQGLEWCRTFVPDVFAVEVNAFQELVAAQFRRRAAELQMVVPVVGLTNSVNKLVRIRRLGPYLAQGSFRFRATAGTRMLVKQLKDFAVGDFDDAPDCAELTLRSLISHVNGRRKPRQPTRVTVR